MMSVLKQLSGSDVEVVMDALQSNQEALME